MRPHPSCRQVAAVEDDFLLTKDVPKKRDYEVVDDFHRSRVGKECIEVKRKLHDHLPIVNIKDSCTDKNHRMAPTIRHNRACGKHQADAMSDTPVMERHANKQTAMGRQAIPPSDLMMW